MKDVTVWMEIEQLRNATVSQLRAKYGDVFGQASRSNHKQFLFRRIAWQLQANASGGLNNRVLSRASQLVRDTDPGFPLPQSFRAELHCITEAQPDRDVRLPPIDQAIERCYRGKQFVVVVRENGFEYNGKLYGSLSSVARQITGTRWNGFHFFGLTEPWRAQ